MEITTVHNKPPPPKRSYCLSSPTANLAQTPSAASDHSILPQNKVG